VSAYIQKVAKAMYLKYGAWVGIDIQSLTDHVAVGLQWFLYSQKNTGDELATFCIYWLVKKTPMSQLWQICAAN